MKIHLDIDQTLVEKARQISRLDSAQEAVEYALTEYIQSQSGTSVETGAKQKIDTTLHPTSKQSPFFGQFLVQNQVINLQELNSAIQFMRKNNPRVGDLAVQREYLRPQQAQELHREQRTVDMFFGDLAVHRGLLTKAQLDELLEEQKARRIRLGDAIVVLGFSTVEKIEETARSFHQYLKEQEKSRASGEMQEAPETQRLEQYLISYLPKMLQRLADVQARTNKLGVLETKHLEEFHGQVELTGPNICTLSVSLDIVLIHHILVGLFSADYEQIFDEPPYEDAISEFLSMLAASTSSQLEKSGYEYKSSAPTVGNPPNQGTTICVETTVGRGIVVFCFNPLP
jgi:hypothetical protein